MTEGEAKKKWCPFARVGFEDATEDTVAWNRLIDDKSMPLNGVSPGTKCIASDCMAWRSTGWYEDEWPSDRQRMHYEMKPIGNTDGFTEHGCCGLAGHPTAGGRNP